LNVTVSLVLFESFIKVNNILRLLFVQCLLSVNARMESH